jgi:cystathionine gamma-lyase
MPQPAEGAKGSEWGPSTRAVRAGLPSPRQGEPLLPGPVLAAPVHLEGDAQPWGYGRDANPTWTLLETALGELEGAEAVVYPSGIAALTALLDELGPGDVLVAPEDAYPGIRRSAAGPLAKRDVEVRLVPTELAAVQAACPGATLVWVESPSNPALDVLDLPALAAAAHDAGARLVVDNTLATPLGQRPLDFGADVSMCSATKALSGHSDLLLGVLGVRDPARAAELRAARSVSGAIPGPFEVWLAHRSLPTLELRLARQSASALALAEMLAGRDDVTGVRHPGLPSHPGHEAALHQMRHFGPLVGFDLGTAERAQAFLAAAELVIEATSFGGVHTTAERRARWGTDAVGEGFIRFSAGCEDTEDLLADVARALDVSR